MDESHPRAHTDPVSGCKPEGKPRAPTKQTRTLKRRNRKATARNKGRRTSKRKLAAAEVCRDFCSDGGGGRGCAPRQASMACSGASHWPASTLHGSRRAHFDTRTSVFGCLALLPPHFVLSHLVASWGELLGKFSYRFLWYMESRGWWRRLWRRRFGCVVSVAVVVLCFLQN